MIFCAANESIFAKSEDGLELEQNQTPPFTAMVEREVGCHNNPRLPKHGAHTSSIWPSSDPVAITSWPWIVRIKLNAIDTRGIFLKLGGGKPRGGLTVQLYCE